MSAKTTTRKADQTPSVPPPGRKMTLQEAIRHVKKKFGKALEKLAQ